MIDLDRMTNDPSYEHYAYRSAIPMPLWARLLTGAAMAIAIVILATFFHPYTLEIYMGWADRIVGVVL